MKRIAIIGCFVLAVIMLVGSAAAGDQIDSTLGSSFDNPITICKEGTVKDKLSEGETIYYKIWLNKDKDVTLSLDFGYLADIISNSNLDIYLYNPDREEVSASTGENWNAFEVDEQIAYNTGSEEGYYYIKIVNLHSQPQYEPEEFSLGVNVKSQLLPTVIEPTPVLLGTYSLELSAPGSKIIDGNIGEIKVFGSSNKYRIEIELDTPVVRLYNAENHYLGEYDIPLTFHGSDSAIVLAFDEKVHMNLDGIAFYDSEGNQIEQGGRLLDALLTDIISIGLGKIIPLPIPTSTLGVLLESQDEMLVPDILSDDITHDVKSVVIAPKKGEIKKVVVFFSKGLGGTPVDNTLHLYVHVKGTGYPSGLSLGQYIPPIIVGTKYINDIPLVKTPQDSKSEPKLSFVEPDIGPNNIYFIGVQNVGHEIDLSSIQVQYSKKGAKIRKADDMLEVSVGGCGVKPSFVFQFYKNGYIIQYFIDEGDDSDLALEIYHYFSEDKAFQEFKDVLLTSGQFSYDEVKKLTDYNNYNFYASTPGTWSIIKVNNYYKVIYDNTKGAVTIHLDKKPDKVFMYCARTTINGVEPTKPYKALFLEGENHLEVLNHMTLLINAEITNAKCDGKDLIVLVFTSQPLTEFYNSVTIGQTV
jgi:hypothetical protein